MTLREFLNGVAFCFFFCGMVTAVMLALYWPIQAFIVASMVGGVALPVATFVILRWFPPKRRVTRQ